MSAEEKRGQARFSWQGPQFVENFTSFPCLAVEARELADQFAGSESQGAFVSVAQMRIPLKVVSVKRTRWGDDRDLTARSSAPQMLGDKMWGVDPAQAKDMIFSYFRCFRSTGYEHASENHHAD